MRAANTLLLVVGLAVILDVLYLAGCFAEKISASRTAAILKHNDPSWQQVVCRPRHGDYWDYTCHVQPGPARPFSLEVKVNGSGITDQSAP